MTTETDFERVEGRLKTLIRKEMERWDVVDPLSVSDAAYLWCRLVPLPQSEDLPPKTYQIAKRIWAIATNLGVVSPGTAYMPAQEFARADYKKMAEKLREAPDFLFPEKRKTRKRPKRGSSLGTLKIYKDCHDLVTRKLQLTNGNVSAAARLAAKEMANELMKPSTIERDYRRFKQKLKASKKQQPP